MIDDDITMQFVVQRCGADHFVSCMVKAYSYRAYSPTFSAYGVNHDNHAVIYLFFNPGF